MRKMNGTRYRRLLAWGATLSLLGGCLPENYFALSARNVAVAITDSLLGLALAPLFGTIAPPSNGNDNANDNANDGG
jgi:hypothetical protein